MNLHFEISAVLRLYMSFGYRKKSIHTYFQQRQISSFILKSIIGAIALLLSFHVKSEAKLSNSINNKAEPGWGLWKKR